jgi:hypothetical protein
MKKFVTVRFTAGTDEARRFIVQQHDGRFWDGRKWTGRLDAARLYYQLTDAQAVCRSIQRRRWKGKKIRHFHCQLTVTVAGDDPVSADAVREYLRRALHLNIDVAAHGDGPGDTFVAVTAKLETLGADTE